MTAGNATRIASSGRADDHFQGKSKQSQQGQPRLPGRAMARQRAVPTGRPLNLHQRSPSNWR